MNEEFLNGAIQIGDELLARAEKDTHGLSWKSTNVTRDNKIVWNISESIYTGTSGVALFLIALYEKTQQKKYLTAAESAMDWTLWYDKQNPTTYYAFITGRLAVSYVFARLYEVTKKKKYLSHAIAIAKESPKFIKDNNGVYDLINGYSGCILPLLKIHSLSNDPAILAVIQEFTQTLLKAARFAKDGGLYWDLGFSQVRPLNGFSHGSAGIGFVFLELGHYFQNPAYYYVAEQAFAYENSSFDKSINNWPDFRLNFYEEKTINEAEDDYMHGRIEKFTSGVDANQWCHGAAGIGLARARAYQLFKKTLYKKDLENAVTKTLHRRYTSFTMCHGDGGNADLFLESYLVFGKQEYLAYARQFGKIALEEKKKFGKYNSGMKFDHKTNLSDTSFFNGIAGIGYFYLRIIDPHAFPSILSLKINTQTKLKPTISLPDIKKRLMQNVFERTLQSAEKVASKKLKAFWQDKANETSLENSFIMFVQKLLISLPKEQKQELQDVFDLELLKVSMQREVVSFGMFFIKERVLSKRAEALLKLTNAQLLTKTLVLTSEVRLTSLNQGQNPILLKQTSNAVEELVISPFCNVVLGCFEKPIKVKQAVDQLINIYNATSPEDKTMIQEKVVEQIREALQYTILHTA